MFFPVVNTTFDAYPGRIQCWKAVIATGWVPIFPIFQGQRLIESHEWFQVPEFVQKKSVVFTVSVSSTPVELIITIVDYSLIVVLL